MEKILCEKQEILDKLSTKEKQLEIVNQISKEISTDMDFMKLKYDELNRQIEILEDQKKVNEFT